MEEAESVGARDDRASGLQAEEAFIAEVRRRRALLDLSQGELAARVSALGENLYQQTIAKLESGQRALKLSEADAIARALGSTVQEMLSTGYAEPSWAGTSISRDMEALEAEAADTIAELQQAQTVEVASRARLEVASENARQAGAEMREAQHALLVAQERVRSLQSRYHQYVAELAKWRAVEEKKRERQRPQ